jgi:hypothetical protein
MRHHCAMPETRSFSHAYILGTFLILIVFHAAAYAQTSRVV